MAVFTPITQQQLTHWLQAYSLGPILNLCGIESGIENSNFFLTTAQGDYVLTVFERLSANALPFYLKFMQHLAARQIPVPQPMMRNDGALLSELNGKPAAIVTRLNGAVQLMPNRQHCAAVGNMLALMHLAGRDFPLKQPNLRSLAWWREVTPVIAALLAAPQRDLLLEELSFQQAFFASADYAMLPGGPCHCDLFRDNVLFVSAHRAEDTACLQNDHNDHLSGCFDFYFAGWDKWLFDIAICVNDWCIHLPSGELDTDRTASLLSSYQCIRPFTSAETRCWHAMLRAGALRFWLSRLYDVYLPRPAKILKPHDPAHFERVLRARIAQHCSAH